MHCHKPCGQALASRRPSSDVRCAWCKRVAHQACQKHLTAPCDLGDLARMTLHSSDIHVNATLPLTNVPDDEARSPATSMVSVKTPGRTPKLRAAGGGGGTPAVRLAFDGPDNVSYVPLPACLPACL
jgi:hypothetical protein